MAFNRRKIGSGARVLKCPHCKMAIIGLELARQSVHLAECEAKSMASSASPAAAAAQHPTSTIAALRLIHGYTTAHASFQNSMYACADCYAVRGGSPPRVCPTCGSSNIEKASEVIRRLESGET